MSVAKKRSTPKKRSDAKQRLASKDPKAGEHQPVKGPRIKKGLVIINTGDGKGKTTAALGVLFRAWGRKYKVRMFQFIKHTGSQFGEQRAAKRIGVPMEALGDGFTWLSKDLERSAALAREQWGRALEAIVGGDDDVVILDEFTYLMHYEWIDVQDVIDGLQRRPPMMHVIITGRYAPQELIDFADLVTEMKLIKHPYRDQGIKAQPGIEF
ncbi:MAG: cob(I)yrinic acid a,c-diamide adenosyltransferase [Chloroflexi bacterium]|nr:cob(I)yrinic acid a,c-diamide adenosyltransferase [Chloroflexota bacterium]